MSLALTLAVGALGGLGAVARVLLDAAVTQRAPHGFPYGTLAVNVVGSVALGVVVGARVEGDAMLILGAGFLGALTTFSGWMVQSRQLAADGRVPAAVVNVAGSLALGFVCLWLGREFGLVL